MKNILVPTDFSPYSDFAITSAATLARKTGGSITLFHVIDEPEDSRELAEKVDKILRSKKLQDVNHHYKQTTGDPIEEIVARESDLIVMGSRGAHGLKGFFIGTNAEKVAKQARCPVITVKEHTDLTKIKSIVYPTDMQMEQEEIIDDIKQLQSFYGAKLHLIKVYDDTMVLQQEVEQRLKAFAEYFKLENYSVTARAGIDQGDEILMFAQELQADMVVMATHDRSGIDALLAGYISGEVINEGTMAIWTRSISGSGD